MLEAGIVQKIRKAVEKDGGWVLKVHGSPSQVAGIPDLIICWRGLFVALEVKRPGGSATPLQAHTLDEISKAGGSVGVVTSVEEAFDVISQAGSSAR